MYLGGFSLFCKNFLKKRWKFSKSGGVSPPFFRPNEKRTKMNKKNERKRTICYEFLFK